MSALEGRECLGRLPIDGDSPQGRSVRGEEAFETIRREMASQTTFSGTGKAVDWAMVAELSEELLSRVGKDLLVGAWLSVSLANTSGAEGLSAGAGVLADLIDHFWETMEPPLAKTRIRLGILDWFEEEAARALEGAGPLSGNSAKKALAAVSRLAAAVSGRVSGEEARGFRSLRDILGGSAEQAGASDGPGGVEAAEAKEKGLPASPRDSSRKAAKLNAGNLGEKELEGPDETGLGETEANGEDFEEDKQEDNGQEVDGQEDSLGRQTQAGREGLDASGISGQRRQGSRRGNGSNEASSGRAKPPGTRREAPGGSRKTFKADPADRQAFRRELLARAGELFELDPEASASYSLRRCALWHVADRIPSATGGRTAIPAPPEGMLSSLRNLVRKGKAAKALSEAEAAADRLAFWLDLSEVSASALRALGWIRALGALEGAAAGLLRASPELARLEFEDGTPLADRQTRNWLGSLEPSSAAGEKEFPGLEAASKILEEGTSGRRSLKLLAKLFPALVESSHLEQIQIHAESIVKLVRRHRLIYYDPSLVAEALEAALAAAGASARGEDMPAWETEATNLLTKLSPYRAAMVARKR